MNDKPNYKQAVINAVNDEFEAFRESELCQSPKQIFEDCHQIYFNREITDYLASDSNGLSKKHYRCLYEDRGRLLPCLWDYYLKSEYATVDTFEEIGRMIKSYNEHNYADFLASKVEM